MSRKTSRKPERNSRAGILAAYAALFEPSIKEVVIIDPPKSHKEGPYFLNVLGVLDIPEALGLLAPNVKLTLINACDPAFDRTEIYRLAGRRRSWCGSNSPGYFVLTAVTPCRTGATPWISSVETSLESISTTRMRWALESAT
jgi:hypothetical protein